MGVQAENSLVTFPEHGVVIRILKGRQKPAHGNTEIHVLIFMEMVFGREMLPARGQEAMAMSC